MPATINDNETLSTCLLMEMMGEFAINFLTGKIKKKRLKESYLIAACLQFVNCQEGTREFLIGPSHILLLRTLKWIHEEQVVLTVMEFSRWRVNCERFLVWSFLHH